MPTHNSYAFLLCVVGVYYTPNTKKTFNYHICLRGLVGVGIDGIYILPVSALPDFYLPTYT